MSVCVGGLYIEKLGGNKRGRRGGGGSREERITRDERNREERIIGGRDERAESKTAREIEMGGERTRKTERCWRAVVQGQANLNFNSLCARGRSGRQFTT